MKAVTGSMSVVPAARPTCRPCICP